MKCTIYDTKPQICSLFHCRPGAEIFGAEKDREQSRLEASGRELIRLSGGIVFAPNPMVKLKSILNDKRLNKNVFLINDLGFCKDSAKAIDTIFKNVGEETLMNIFKLFDGSRTIDQVISESARILEKKNNEELAVSIKKLTAAWEYFNLIVPVLSCTG